MAASNVLVVGLRGLGAEIAKNVALAESRASPSSTPLLSPLEISAHNSSSDQKMSLRALAGITLLSHVSLSSTLTFPSSARGVRAHRMFFHVPGCRHDRLFVCRASPRQRHHPRHLDSFHSAEVRGLFGSVFNDFGPKFLCNDPTGEQPLSGMIVSIASEDEEGLVTTLDETRHGLEDGDYVAFTEVQGMEALNNAQPRKVTVKGPYTFTIGSTKGLGEYKRGGIFSRSRCPRRSPSSRCARVTSSPNSSSPTLPNSTALPHCTLVSRHCPNSSRRMVACHDRGTPKMRSGARAYQADLPGPGSGCRRLAEKVVRELAFQAQGDVSPMVAYVGGFVAQEVLKACSGKFHPLVSASLRRLARVAPRLGS